MNDDLKPLDDLDHRVTQLAAQDASYMIIATALLEQYVETLILAHLPKVLSD